MSDKLPPELDWLTRAHLELAEARTVQAFKAIREHAEGTHQFARCMHLPVEVQIYAAELRLTAKRRAGAGLAGLKLAKGGRPAKRTKNRYPRGTGLRELEISKKQSASWQRLAAIPDEAYQRYLTECRGAGKEPTTTWLLDLEKRLCGGKAKPKNPPRRVGQAKSKRGADPSATDARKLSGAKDLSEGEDASWELAEARRHQGELKRLLADYFSEAPVVRPDPIDRRYAAKLFNELGEYLAQIEAKQRQPSHFPDAESPPPLPSHDHSG